MNNMFDGNGRRGRRKSEKYKDWITMAGYALARLKPRHTIDGKVELVYTFGKRGTRADLGNLEKAVTDLLVEHRVIVDDSAQYVEKITLQWGQGDSLAIEVYRHG
jgi:Holliday junction resolvase RusA-like endonuclease